MTTTLFQFAKFIVAGLINSGITVVVYHFLAPVIGVQIAYTSAYILGIGISYFLNAYLVFKAGVSKRSARDFPLVYVVQYVIGLVVVNLIEHYTQAPHYLAAMTVVAVNAPLTFLLARFIFLRNQKG